MERKNLVRVFKPTPFEFNRQSVRTESDLVCLTDMWKAAGQLFGESYLVTLDVTSEIINYAGETKDFSETKITRSNKYLLSRVWYINYNDFYLKVHVRDSGELVFLYWDLVRFFIYDGDAIPSQQDFWLTFSDTLQFLIKFKGGYETSCALILYLQSFGNDYFLKFYKRFCKEFNVDINIPPFVRSELTICIPKWYETNRDFKNVKDNHCGIVGDLYILEFSTGVIKVGKSKNCISRIKQHKMEAERHMVQVLKEFYVLKSTISEDVLIQFCLKNGNLFWGNEYFLNLSFDKVKRFLVSCTN